MWTGIGIAALALVVTGLLGRASRPVLTAQTAALLVFGGLAVTALSSPRDSGWCWCWPVSCWPAMPCGTRCGEGV